MPLSEPVARKHQHTRRITCDGYQREDGLWDIDAHLIDTRGYAYSSPWRGEVPIGAAGHEMWLRWTVDAERVIQAIEVVTDASPYPTSCPQATAPYERLVGARVGGGFNKEVHARIGRTEGCTHLFTLIQAAANATMQTLAGAFWNDDQHAGRKGSVFGGSTEKPGLLDTCHSYRASGPIVKVIWPGNYTGPDKD